MHLLSLIFRKPTDIMYSVELDDGDLVTVSRSSLFMTEDQAKILRERVAIPLPTKSRHPKADVSLGENILVYCSGIGGYVGQILK
jgi:hypothetical protein